VPGHTRIDGNKTTNEMTRQGSSYPLTGHHPARGVSAKVARGVDQGLDK